MLCTAGWQRGTRGLLAGWAVAGLAASVGAEAGAAGGGEGEVSGAGAAVVVAGAVPVAVAGALAAAALLGLLPRVRALPWLPAAAAAAV